MRCTSTESGTEPIPPHAAWLPNIPLIVASGLGLGFFPANLPFIPLLAVSIAAAATGITLLGLRLPISRRFGRAALAFGASLLLGAALARDSGLLSHPLAVESFSAAPIGGTKNLAPYPTRHADDKGTPPSVSPGLRIAAVTGRLGKDATAKRGGSTTYRITVERILLLGPGISGECGAIGRSGRGLAQLDATVGGGSLLDAGTKIELRCHPRPGQTRLFAQARDIAVLDRGSAIERVRSRVRNAVRDALVRVGRSSAGLLLALILGAQDCLEREDADAFKAAGCTHILALSGEHLSVLAVLALFALKPLFGPLRARLGAAILATLFVWVAGPAPSLVRAVLMVWLSAVALYLDRPQPWLVILCLSFAVYLPFDIEADRSLSFVLSYLAVWGLATLAPRYEFLLVRWMPPPFAFALAASLAAQAAVAPVLIATFGSLSLVGVLASVAAAPLVTAFMWWGLAAAVICSLAPFLASAAVPVSDLLYLLLTGIMKTAAAVPSLSFQDTGARIVAACVVVVLAGFVYALPDVSYRLRLPRSPRLRRAGFAQSSARKRGLGHVQALRTELPGQ